MGLIARANEALTVNPPEGDSVFTVNGSDWLWAVTAIYCFSFVVFFALSFKPFSGERIFHYIFTVALLVGTICYYSWAADLAFVVVNGRQIFWAKYVFCRPPPLLHSLAIANLT
jgi:bacteriorhodopsin